MYCIFNVWFPKFSWASTWRGEKYRAQLVRFVCRPKLETVHFTSVYILFGDKLAKCFSLTARETGACFLTLYTRRKSEFWQIAGGLLILHEFEVLSLSLSLPFWVSWFCDYFHKLTSLPFRHRSYIRFCGTEIMYNITHLDLFRGSIFLLLLEKIHVSCSHSQWLAVNPYSVSSFVHCAWLSCPTLHQFLFLNL